MYNLVAFLWMICIFKQTCFEINIDPFHSSLFFKLLEYQLFDFCATWDLLMHQKLFYSGNSIFRQKKLINCSLPKEVISKYRSMLTLIYSITVPCLYFEDLPIMTAT